MSVSFPAAKSLFDVSAPSCYLDFSAATTAPGISVLEIQADEAAAKAAFLRLCMFLSMGGPCRRVARLTGSCSGTLILYMSAHPVFGVGNTPQEAHHAKKHHITLRR